MKTKLLNNTIEDIKLAAEIIRKGELVAFPTETVYGLGANGLDAEAAGKIYKAKGRPSDNPMILHISNLDMLCDIVDEVPDVAKKLMEKFWPGPLTVVLPCNASVPKVTTGGLDTVGIRMPKNEIALDLIELSGVPIAAPSANISGKPSPTTYGHVVDDMDGKIEAIICGDDCDIGIESTVISVINDEVTILRPGYITKQMFEEILGRAVNIDKTLFRGITKSPNKSANEGNQVSPTDEVSSSLQQIKTDADGNFKPLAPGMKYKHYAPDAEMIVFRGEETAVDNAIEEKYRELTLRGKSVGIIRFESKEKAAKELFAKLRQMDKEQKDIILAGAVNDDGLGFSVMNRMLKSAGYNIIDV